MAYDCRVISSKMSYSMYLSLGSVRLLQHCPGDMHVCCQDATVSPTLFKNRGGRYQNNVATIYHVLVITIFDIITIMRFG